MTQNLNIEKFWFKSLGNWNLGRPNKYEIPNGHYQNNEMKKLYQKYNHQSTEILLDEVFSLLIIYQ